MKIRSRILGFVLSVPLATALSVAGDGVAHTAQIAIAAAGPADVVGFHNIGSDKCAEPTGLGNGARVVQRPCDATNTDNNQKWVLAQVGSGVFEFVNVGASKCMDVTDGRNADHTADPAVGVQWQHEHAMEGQPGL